MERFSKVKEWVKILDKLSILQPVGFPYTGNLAVSDFEQKRVLFDELNNHYISLCDIEKTLICRDAKKELQDEFLEVIAGESKENVNNTIELIREYFALKCYENLTKENVMEYDFIKDLIKNDIITKDEALRLAFKMVSVIRYRNILCTEIKEAYLQFLDNEKTKEFNPEGVDLPDELNTQKAQKTFAKAIAKGWIIRTEGGFKWLGTDGKGSKAQLSYLCAKVYGYRYNVTKGNVGDNVPFEALERLFNVPRLDRAMQQTFEAKKPQQWRGIIDKIITE